MLNKSKLLMLDWQKIFDIDFYIYKDIKKRNKVLFICKTLIKLFFLKLRIPNRINTDFIFYKSMIRKDYDSLFNQIVDQCSYKKESVNLKYSKGFNINIFFVFLRYKFLVRFLKEKYNINSIYFILKLYQYIQLLEYFEKNFEFNQMVVFADMQPTDNMLVQYNKLKGIKTITLQHGLYVDYDKYNNINIVNYRNIVSDYFLAWGSETKELVEKYHGNLVKVIICGKPSLQIENLKVDYSDIKYFTILFDQNMFQEYNKELLKVGYLISKELNLMINIKFHPNNNKSDYNVNFDMVFKEEMPIDSSRFILGHTTTMIYEMLRVGHKVFKLASDVPCNKAPFNIVFTHANDLIKKVNNNIPELTRKYFIEDIGTDSLIKYKKFFEVITNG